MGFESTRSNSEDVFGFADEEKQSSDSEKEVFNYVSKMSAENFLLFVQRYATNGKLVLEQTFKDASPKEIYMAIKKIAPEKRLQFLYDSIAKDLSEEEKLKEKNVIVYDLKKVA